AQARVDTLHEAARPEAQLYLENPENGIGGAGAFFLLLDRPEVYGLPPDPVVSTRALPNMWKHAGLPAAALGAMAGAPFAGRRRGPPGRPPPRPPLPAATVTARGGA